MDGWSDIIETPCGHTQRYLSPRRETFYMHHSNLLGDECFACHRPGVQRDSDGHVYCPVRTTSSAPPEVPRKATRERGDRAREAERVEGQREFFW